MDVLQTVMNFFSSMGTTLLAVLFVLIALILIWLIVRASRRGPHAETADKPTRPNRYRLEPEPHQSNTPAPAQAGSSQPTVAAEPEDSVLHRHYETELAAKKEAASHPYPTDSVLRRHYDTEHRLHLPEPSGTAPKAAASAADSDKNLVRKSSIIEQAVKKDAQIADLPAEASRCEYAATDSRLPQDSVLKRHFISQLQAEVQADLPPRPTDSVLRRHYDALVQAKLQSRLGES